MYSLVTFESLDRAFLSFRNDGVRCTDTETGAIG
jgi:hypothetical protein